MKQYVLRMKDYIEEKILAVFYATKKNLKRKKFRLERDDMILFKPEFFFSLFATVWLRR